MINVLDNILKDKDLYEQKKRQSINRHLLGLSTAVDDKERLTQLALLFDRYRKYKLDSALYYANQCIVYANRLGNKQLIANAMMDKAEGYKGLGEYNDALSTLYSIPKENVAPNSRYYYYLCYSVYLAKWKKSSSEEESTRYKRILRDYRDTISTIVGKNSSGSAVNEAEILKMEGKYRASLKVLLDFQKRYPDSIKNDAIFWCTGAELFHLLGEKDAEKYYLTMGAIIDKKNCVKTYTSLQNLAMLLYNEGDTERAYRYISCAMQDIMSCNARSRLIHVAEYMPIITAAYDAQQERAQSRKNFYISLVSILVLFMLVLLAILYKRNNKLLEARKKLDEKNEELNKLNMNLNSLNLKLRESNKIKEEYIAQLFNICSGYIDDMDKYRLSLVRKLKAGQTTELRDELNSPISAKSLKEFFRKFDMIFLELFPNFIESFNELLYEDARLEPKGGELLSPELRIYALVRLGINDSTKIASFLHYSSQTVYNYRLKVRSRAIVPKEEFIERVQLL